MLNKEITHDKRLLGFGSSRRKEPVTDDVGKPAVAEYDVPDMPGDQLRCDVCGEPATNSSTDAVEQKGMWTETKAKYGCNAHVVYSMIHFEDGRRLTAQEYEAGCQAEPK
jgi:hypothetical protein